MIIRPLLLRHGRIALPKTPTPPGTVRRSLTTSPLRRQQEQQQQRSARRSDGLPPSEVRDPNHPVARDWMFYHHQKARTGDMGTALSAHYKPNDLIVHPPRPQDITLELLMASQAHIGHATSLWHPSNAKYIFGVRGGHDPIHIISLDVTAAHLRRACKILHGVTSRGGLVLFVGTRDGQARTVVKAARLAKACHLFTKWTPGSITNRQQILGACSKLVVDETDTRVLGFGDQLRDASPALKPDLVVCLNPLENYVLLHECGVHNIPTVGIVDTDCNPAWLTYPIPANDDSTRSVNVICGALGQAGAAGQKARLERAARGEIVSEPSHGLEPPTEGQAERDAEVEERARLAEVAFEERLMLEISQAQAQPQQVVASREEEVEMFDRQPDEVEEGDFLPYERDRPLSEEELAEASSRDVGEGR